jgi:hypothetical protein
MEGPRQNEYQIRNQHYLFSREQLTASLDFFVFHSVIDI